MWENIVRGRPQMTMWGMRIACWIPKATNTHTGYVILIVFPLQQWLHERASMLRYTYIACLALIWLTINETHDKIQVSVLFQCLWNRTFVDNKNTADLKADVTRGDSWRDFRMCVTGTGQQVTQLYVRICWWQCWLFSCIQKHRERIKTVQIRISTCIANSLLFITFLRDSRQMNKWHL